MPVKPAPAPPVADQAEHKRSKIDLERELIDRLRGYKKEHSHLTVHFAGTEQRPTAEFLIQVFRDAGWTTFLGPYPMDTYAPLEFRQGVEIRGINSHLVQAVAQFLTDAGLKSVKPVMQQTTLKPSDVNWEQASAGITIIVGH